jgi:hypothetical protein
MEVMGIILFAIGAVGLVILLYSVFCYAPSEECQKENADNCERKAKEKDNEKE